MLMVLMYIFKNGLHHSEYSENERVAVSQKLHDAGFEEQDVRNALDILEQLNHDCAHYADRLKSSAPTETEKKDDSVIKNWRLYTTWEYERLGIQFIDLIIQLEREGFLSPVVRELLIHHWLSMQKEEPTDRMVN